jgi:WD40 repeat protein
MLTLGFIVNSFSQVEIPIPDTLALGAIGHRGHTNDIKSVSFSRDNKILATSDTRGTFCLWDLEKGRLSQIIEISNFIEQLVISPDGSLLAISGTTAGQGMIYLFKTEQGTIIHRIRFSALDMEFSPDGKSLFAAGFTERFFDESTSKFINKDECIVSWDVATGQENGRFSQPDFSPAHITCNLDGSKLAVAARGTGIWLIPASLREEPQMLTRANNFVSSLTFSPSGDMIAYCCIRDSACVIDATSGNRIAYFPDSTNSIYKTVFGPDGRTLISLYGIYWSENQTMTAVNLATREIEQKLIFGEHSIIGFTNEARIALLENSGAIRLLDLKTGDDLLTIPGEPPAIRTADGFPLRLLAIGPVQRSATPPEGFPGLSANPSQEYWRIDIEMENHGSDLFELTSPSEVQIVQGTFREEAGLGTLLLHNKGKDGFPLMYLLPLGGGTTDQSLVISQNNNGVQQYVKTTLRMQPHERVGAGLVFIVPKKKKEKDYQLQLMIPSFRARLPVPAETKQKGADGV